MSNRPKKTRPKVSVIIPVYNFGHFLPFALKSVFSQTYKDFEVIVVDDASTDNTLVIARKYWSKITYITHKTNRGFASSMNTGVKKAKGKYVTFLSGDDLLLPDFLEKEVAVLENNPNVGLVHSGVFFIDKRGRKIGRSNLENSYTGRNDYQRLVIGNFMYLVTVLTRTELIRKVGYFNTKLRQMPDWDMWLRITYESKSAYIPYYLSVYRKHEASLTAEIRRNFENIGRERKIILSETINKRKLHYLLKALIPLLFLDALLSLKFRQPILVKLISLFSLAVSIFTGRILRFIYRLL